MTTFKRVGFEIDAQGQALDYAKRAMSIRDNHPTPVIPAGLRTHVVNRISGEGFVFLGLRGNAVVLERNGDQAIEVVARWCFQRDYQATCAHFYGQHDSCPMCDAEQENRPLLYPNSGLDVIVQQRDEARAKLDNLRMGVARLVGAWSAGSAKEAHLSRVLESVLKEHQ